MRVISALRLGRHVGHIGQMPQDRRCARSVHGDAEDGTARKLDGSQVHGPGLR